MMRKAVTVTKWVSVSITSLIVVTFAAMGFLLFTNSGLNTILWGAEKALPALKVQQASGTLFPRFSLQGVEFKDEQLGVDFFANKLTLAIDHRCFLSPAICIDELSSDQLRLALSDVATSPEPESEPSDPITQVSTPLPITINKLALTNIQLDIYGTQVEWQTFTSGASFEGDVATLTTTLLENSSVTLAESEGESAAESTQSEQENTESISLPEIWIPLEVVIEQIDINHFTQQSETPFVVHHLGLAGRAKGHSVELDKLALDIDEVEAQLQASIELKDDYPLRAQLDATAKLEMAAGEKIGLTLEGSVGELALALTTQGVNNIQLNGEVQPLEPTMPFTVEIKDSNVQWPLVGKGDYSVVVTHLQGTGTLDAYQAKLNGSVTGTGIPELVVSLDGKGTLSDIDLNYIKVDTLGGSIEGQVASQWEDLVTWQADVDLTTIQPGLYWPEAEGNVSGKLVTTGGLTDAGGWYIDLPTLDVQGIIREYPLELLGSLKASDRAGSGEYQLDTPGLKLGHGPNQLRVEGSLDKDWALDIDLQLPTLAKSVPELTGSAKGNVYLRGELANPEVNVDLSAESVQWQTLAGLQSLSVKGSLLPASDPAVSLRVEALDLAYEDFKAPSLDVNLDGTLTEHRLDVDLDSEVVGLILTLAGDFNQQENTWQGTLNDVQVTTEQGPWRIQQPVKIFADIGSTLAKVSAHCWAQSSSSICLDKDIEVSQQAGDVSLSVNQFDFSQLAQYLPQETELNGSVDANVEARWTDGKVPQVKAQVVLAPGSVTQKLNEPLNVAWQQSTLNATFVDNRVDANWQIDIEENGDITGQVTIPDVLANDRTLDGELKLTPFNLDFLAPIVGPYSELKANIEADIKISGPLMQPRANGYFKVDQMALSGEISPVSIKQGQLNLNFNGYQATLDALIQTAEGDLNVKGDADWQDLADWHSDIRVFADGLMVEVPPMVKVRVEPDMTISMSPKQAKVQGDIHLPWARIDVQSLPESAVSVSSDQVILDENLEPEEEDTTIPFALETDVNIHIGDDFKLSAFGLNGSLVGNLNVAQRDKGPVVNGEVNILDGYYRSFGQDLLIDEGKILMNGPVDQPYIVITAIRNPDNTEDDVTAGIRVTGPADEPVVEIFSEPAMPQANALSYLLRGQDIDGESGGNAITTTLIGLSLARSGKVVGEIGEAFGVQDLQLDTAGTGDDSQVTVSGYILPGLQVKYGVGIFDSVGEFTVRYRIMKDLYIEVVSGLDSAVDVLYQFEFD
ncbi:autotransporter assembly complex protein TamB [Vibrio astriarenae]|uniref:autotransporter assembly complex protein TamB n=1 Tax=Vibrio astriarenae TaxID=1481923 RepID=UPI00373577AA